MDVNNDGWISRDELHDFFIQHKNILDDEIRFRLVDEIYGDFDVDGDGMISLDEFIQRYIETRNRLNDKHEEVMKNIIDHAHQANEVKKKLRDAEQTEHSYITRFGIRNDAKLKVHIIDAMNLEEDTLHYVKVF